MPPFLIQEATALFTAMLRSTGCQYLSQPFWLLAFGFWLKTNVASVLIMGGTLSVNPTLAGTIASWMGGKIGGRINSWHLAVATCGVNKHRFVDDLLLI